MRIFIVSPPGKDLAGMVSGQPAGEQLSASVFTDVSAALAAGRDDSPRAVLIHDDLVSDAADLKPFDEWPLRVPLLIVSEYANERILAKYREISVHDFLYLPLWSGAVAEMIAGIEAYWRTMIRSESRGSILVVDDDEGVLSTSCQILIEEGYDAEGVGDGLTAVERATAKDYDLIITDIRMRGITGIETLRRIKTVRPEAQVVVFTAYADVDTAIEAMQFGAYDYIRKPFKINYFLDVVRKAVGYRRLIEDNARLMKLQKEGMAALRRRYYETSVINEFNHRAESVVDERQLVAEFFDSLEKIVDFEAAAILVASPTVTHLYHRYAWLPTGADIEATARIIVAQNPHLAALAVLGDLSHDDLQGGKRGPRQPLSSDLVIPLGSRRRALGSLYLGRSAARSYAETERETIAGFAAIVGHLMEKLLALKSREQIHLKAVVAGMPNGIIMSDVQGNIVVMNEAAKEMLSLKRSGDPRTIENLGRERGLPIQRYIDELAAEGKRGLSRELYLSKPREIVLNVDVTLILDDDGASLGYVTLLRDITELKEIDRMKSEFVSIVSHEMRTPLTTIKNSVNIVLKGTAGTVNENQLRFLSMAQESIERMTRLIGNLLDLSKIESGKMALSFEPVDVIELLGKVKKHMQSMGESKSVQLVMKTAAALPQVLGDRDRLDQVFTNLIHNAIKYSPQDGTVEMECRMGKAEEIPAELMEGRAGGNYLAVDVRDFGPGIPAEFQRVIFDKFQQVESTLKREMGGIGLGLAIARGIVQAHHGALWVESLPGQGSTFKVFLPTDRRHTDRGE